MKILVRLFFIMLVMFSYIEANEPILKALYDSKINEFQKGIDHANQAVKNNLAQAKHSPEQTEQLQPIINRYKEKARTTTNQLNVLKNQYKKSPLDVYKTLYKEHKDKLIKDIDTKKKFINKHKNNISYSPWVSNYRNDVLIKEKKLEDLRITYNKYLKSLKTKKTIVKKDIKVKNKLKLSTVNAGRTSITSSNFNTNVKIKNVNVSQKANASVGSVSIGKDKKE